MPPDIRQGDYLRECLRRFPEVCRLKYGVEFDLASVEEKVRHLRRSTPLSYEDLQYFGSPEHYGIYSSPIQHMLDIRHGRDLVETYLAYLDNIRNIMKHYGFARVADLDMALWVLHEKCFGRYQDPGIADAYLGDDFMLQLRANNLVAPLAGLSVARLAKALFEVKPDLAVLIACRYLEILIRKAAAQFHLEELDSNAPLEKIIKAFPNYAWVDSARKALWDKLRQIRNACLHKDQLPGPRDSRLLIDEVNKLESDINTGVS
jgi:hypothetical protein